MPAEKSAEVLTEIVSEISRLNEDLNDQKLAFSSIEQKRVMA
jgi:hypothetical protein